MECLRPFFIKREGKDVLVPCGKCYRCKSRRISAWSFRLMQELKEANSAYFITLTYNDEYLPITRNGYHTVRKTDLQKFFKRLRRAHDKAKNYADNPIKYFAVAEYGGKIGRPHYHVILFNANVKKIQKAWSSYKWVRNVRARKRIGKDGRYHTVRYKKQWHHMGHIHYGDKRGVCAASVGYCLKYILKPKEPENKRCKRDDSERERIYCSTGLGKAYVDQKIYDWHRADINNRMYVNLELGKKATMPRYYKDIIYTKEEREQIAKLSRDKITQNILKELFKCYQEDPENGYNRHKWNKEQQANAYDRKQQSLIKKTLQHV